MKEFLSKMCAPADEKDLASLEQALEKSLPQQYRQLLLLANGADFKEGYLQLPNNRGDWVLSYDSWSHAKTQLDILINHDNKNNLYIQHQEHLFPIAGTSKGNEILIGLSGIYKDKVFISDKYDDVYNDERTVFPVHQVADSLYSFLRILQPNPDELQ